MEQASFNQIQSNFKLFLNGKLHPGKKELVKESVDSSPEKEKIEAIENTCLFGSEDSAIGFKKYYTDENGKRKYKIVSSK